MVNPEQQHMLDQLAEQKLRQQQVDRILKIIIPVVAFLLTMICANLTWQSTVGTFIVLWIGLYAVGVWRFNLYYSLFAVAVYCLVDIYFCFQGNLPVQAIGRQMGTMLTFMLILGLSRPYIDRWLVKSAAAKS